MKFLGKLLPKGSGPFGFGASAKPESTEEKPDTSYLDDLIKHEEAGVVMSFMVLGQSGQKKVLPTFTGRFGRRVSTDSLKAQIDVEIKEVGTCHLIKCVKVRDDGKTPLLAVQVANFQDGRLVGINKAFDNSDRPAQSLQGPPELTGGQ